MKQGKLIRRAVSAALAGCMMFTFSAPALAESTDALMQLSMTRRSAVSVLDAENGDIVNYGITVTHGKKAIPVTSANCDNILGDSSDSTLSYDPAAKKLTSNGTIYGLLSINAPGVDVELNGKYFALQDSGLNGILTIENANDVTVSSQKFAAVQSDVNVTCTGKLTVITNDSSWAAIGRNLTVHSAASVQIESEGDSAVGGDVIIECACPATFFKKNQNGRIAQSITYAGDYGYYTDDTADTAIDPNVMPIPVETAKYVRIAPKMRYNINTAEDAAIKLQGQNTELKTAFAGEKVTVTAAGRENAEFTDWTDPNGVLKSDQLTAKEVNFTMPDEDVTLIPNYNVVQDYGLEVGSENTTPTRVTSKNCKDILGNGVLSYDPTTQTLKSDGRIKRSSLKINAPGKDINLDGKDQIAVAAKLIVENAHNVKVSSDKYAAIFARDDTSTIDCTGKVDIRSGGDVVVNGNLSINNLGDVDLYANGNSISNKALTITSGGNVTIESTDGRAAQNLTINKAEDVTISISDDERAVSENTKITASGTVILKNTAEGGPVGTVDFTQAGDKDYVYYTSDEPDAKLIDPRIHPLPDTVESSYLRIEPRETYYSITVANGTAQVGDDTTGRITTAFEGETVTVKAKAPTDEDAAKGVKFHHWKVEEGSTAFTLTDGKLGSKEEAGTEEISFDMPKGDVKLTAVYSIPASVLRSTVTVEGGTAKSTLGEGSDIPAEIGTTVEITATPYDAEKYPGMEFVEWEIKYPDSFYEKFPDGIPENLQLKLDNAKSAATTFEMPVYPVKLIAHWSASPVAKPDPDEPIDEDFGVEPAPMDTTGGAIAAVAVGGAAIWGGYEIATRIILNDLLPAGAAIPANRGQLALLIWTEKGKPEPAAQPAFADITDAEQAKAAQWCVEQGTMDAKGDCFEPEGWTPKFKVIEVWNKAFPKQ
ncbi:InlB B-repeat-containing protein [Faecalibacterium taiwanense]|uniref:InlB B-repeat-containing protein n=1 Tax=Faecalibacterium taiwanense TaxID=3030638 RepID=UPI003AB0DCCC